MKVDAANRADSENSKGEAPTNNHVAGRVEAAISKILAKIQRDLGADRQQLCMIPNKLDHLLEQATTGHE